MTVKNDASLNRAVLVGGIFILAMTGIAFTVGPLSNAVFFQKFGKISIAMAKGNIDKIIPIYIEKIMPSWFATLFLLSMLAAAMSTLSSHYHVGGTSLGRDLYEKGLGKRGGGEVMATRFGVGLTILLTIAWGLFLTPKHYCYCHGVFLRALFIDLSSHVFFGPLLETYYQDRCDCEHGWRVCGQFLLVDLYPQKGGRRHWPVQGPYRKGYPHRIPLECN